MTWLPTTSRSLPLAGVLAVAAVVLAVGLLFASPSPAAAVGLASLPTTADESPPSSPDSPAGEPASSAFCRRASLPSGEAWRQSHATPRSVDSRSTEFGVLLVPKGGASSTAFPACLDRFRGRLPLAAHPSLHVLFCTWLA